MEELTRWIAIPFPENLDLKDFYESEKKLLSDEDYKKQEDSRKKRLEGATNVSWEGFYWIISLLSTELVRNSRGQKGKAALQFMSWFVKSLGEWLLFALPMYLMLFLALWNFYASESLQVVVYVVGLYILIVLAKEDLKGSAKGLLMGSLTVAILGGVTYWILFIRKESISVFIISLLFDIVLLYILIEIIRGLATFALGTSIIESQNDSYERFMFPTWLRTAVIYSTQFPKLTLMLVVSNEKSVTLIKGSSVSLEI
jgi:hypothetical protein